MISIRKATVQDIPTIQKIAYETWPATYDKIISQTQLDYMLDLFYSTKLLKETISQPTHHFLIAYNNVKEVGFAGIEFNYFNEPVTRLHKLYILPEAQGQGVGKLIIESVTKLALSNKNHTISLNVNRFNSAYFFYLKNGFKVINEVDIELDHGYLMEDFIMEKPI